MTINIIAKCSLDSVANYIEPDKMYNIYFITSVNNNNSKGVETFKVMNKLANASGVVVSPQLTYIKKSRIIKKSLIFLNENDEVVIPLIDYDIRYILIEEI